MQSNAVVVHGVAKPEGSVDGKKTGDSEFLGAGSGVGNPTFSHMSIVLGT
jgi:hypothetical protein